MKPPLRTKSVGTKVSEAEFALLEERARAAGLTLSEWVRDLSSKISASHCKVKRSWREISWLSRNARTTYQAAEADCKFNSR
jgi:hypothetical protein